MLILTSKDSKYLHISQCTNDRQKEDLVTVRCFNLYSLCLNRGIWELLIILKLDLTMQYKKSPLENQSTVLQNGPDHFSGRSPVVRKRGKKYDRWTYEENQAYVQFLKENKEQFSRGKKRRQTMFFKEMSFYLNKVKTNVQCRSHHQKMIDKYGSTKQIIRNLLNDKDDSFNPEEPRQNGTISQTTLTQITLQSETYLCESMNIEYQLWHEDFFKDM